jgi:hypothetical protein
VTSSPLVPIREFVIPLPDYLEECSVVIVPPSVFRLPEEEEDIFLVKRRRYSVSSDEDYWQQLEGETA